jgi:hypothetical protein
MLVPSKAPKWPRILWWRTRRRAALSWPLPCARAAADRGACFALLVPATARRHLLASRRGREVETAERMAQSARLELQSLGLNVIRAVPGVADPIAAIAGEVGAQSYASIIICTHPGDVSRWLKARVPQRAQEFGLPVIHVVVRSVALSMGASRPDVSRLPLA